MPRTDTIEQLVDEHEVVLHILLVHLAEIGLHGVREPVEELEHHRRVDVVPSHSAYPDVSALYVEEGRPCHVRNRAADLQHACT